MLEPVSVILVPFTSNGKQKLLEICKKQVYNNYCFPKNVKNEHIFLTLHFYDKFKFEENKQSRTLQKFWIGR